MPTYDQGCKSCGWEREIIAKIGENPPCPECGGETERVWRGKSAAVQDDTIIGGEVNENVGHKPVTFYSKSEKRRYLKEHNLEPFVRHVGEQGSDKNPRTSRWV